MQRRQPAEFERYRVELGGFDTGRGSGLISSWHAGFEGYHQGCSAAEDHWAR